MVADLRIAVREDLKALGGGFRELRADMSQEELAGRLQQYGYYDMTQKKISVVERGLEARPTDACVAEAWARVAGVSPGSEPAQRIIEARKIVEWVCDLHPLVPHAITRQEFVGITRTVGEVCSRGEAGDIRTVRHLLRRGVSDQAWHRYVAAVDVDRRTPPAGLWLQGSEKNWEFDSRDYPKSVQSAVKLVLKALGERLKRLHGETSQKELAARLSRYGFRIGQQRISDIERGDCSYPLHCCVLEAWVRLCGYYPNDPRARAVFEFRKLTAWYCAAAILAPSVTRPEAFRDVGIGVAVLSAQGPGDIERNRRMLQRAFSDLCWERYEKSR